MNRTGLSLLPANCSVVRRVTTGSEAMCLWITVLEPGTAAGTSWVSLSFWAFWTTICDLSFLHVVCRTYSGPDMADYVGWCGSDVNSFWLLLRDFSIVVNRRLGPRIISTPGPRDTRD